jgi:hypothetical protein
VKYNKEDLPKIAILSLVLAALVIYIVVSFIKLSAKAQRDLAAHEAEHARAAAAGPRAPGAVITPGTVSPAVAALINPVAPPDRDPFSPVISPRRPSAVAAPPAPRPKPGPPGPLVLPPLAGGAAGPQPASNLPSLTGIIVGTPTLAVIRRGEDHFIVKQGDELPGRVRVQAVTRNSVTLRDSKGEYTLRLGG